MSDKVNQPTGGKQGCRVCFQLTYHDIRCRLAKGLDSPVLPSERSVGDERKGLMLCCMRTAERYGDSQRWRAPIQKGTTITCEKCGQQIESLGGRAWKAK